MDSRESSDGAIHVDFGETGEVIPNVVRRSLHGPILTGQVELALPPETIVAKDAQGDTPKTKHTYSQYYMRMTGDPFNSAIEGYDF